MFTRVRIAYLIFLSLVLVIVHSAVHASDPDTDQRNVLIHELYEQYRIVFEDLHRHPELSGQEVRTAQKVLAELNKLNLDEVTSGVGGHGVVGVLRNGIGPTLLMRADMDALPIQEESGLPYASQNPGVMHACGHDFHVASILASAHVLSQLRDQWSGTLVIVFQPAEEALSGAGPMIADGLFTRFPKPDMAIALHTTGNEPSGKISYRPEYFMAASDSVDVEFTGRGAHGSAPHLSIDPIEMAVEYVTKMNAIIAREVSPLQPALITVGSIHAGTRYNIIPDKAHLQMTIRTYDEDVRNYIKRRVVEVAGEIAEAGRAPIPPVVHFPYGVGATYNDPTLAAQLGPVFKNVVGESNVTIRAPVMGAEDFSEFLRQGKIPGHYFFVGVTDPAVPKPWPGNHTARFSVDFARAWPVGVKAMTAAVTTLLPVLESAPR
ncbi:MAG: M20 family metallopeptidase [Bdellovibrionales bacterium]